MPAGTGRDGDEAVGALFDGFLREAIVDDVVQDDAAVGVHGLVDLFPRAEGGDHDRRLVLHAQLEVLLQTLVGPVHDEIHGIGGGRCARVHLVEGLELRGDALQPALQFLDGPGVEGRKGTHDAGLALGDDEVRVGNDEQRRAHDRQAEA